jgi:hypothetical protein
VAFREPPEDLSALLFAQARGCGLHKDSPSRWSCKHMARLPHRARSFALSGL